MNVYQKLNEARAKFHKKALKKSGHNKFAGYNYFELGDFVIPAIEIFNEVGLTSIIRFGKEIAEFIVVNTEKPDEIIVFTSPMSEANLKGCHPVQNLGAVQTYISRYLWVSVLHIVEHDSLDATTGRKGDAPIITPKGNPEVNEEDQEFLMGMATSCEELVGNGKAKEASQMLDEAMLDADQKIWLWGQLTSTTRAAIKKAKG
jgi:hypothetical protein